MVMSSNLMAALGLETSAVEAESDWKPPEQSGLKNSAPIVE
jgi:hypothetical protein